MTDVENLAKATIKQLDRVLARVGSVFAWKLARSYTEPVDRATIAAPITRDSFLIDYRSWNNTLNLPREKRDDIPTAFRVFTFKPKIAGVTTHHLDHLTGIGALACNGSQYLAEHATIVKRAKFDDARPLLAEDEKPSASRIARLLYQSRDTGSERWGAGLDGTHRRYLEIDESFGPVWRELADDVAAMDAEVQLISGLAPWINPNEETDQHDRLR